MCCPHFLPERRAAGPNEGAGPLPLGDEWQGICGADHPPAGPLSGPAALRLCNMGYARGTCSRFPAAEGPDAVRFIVSRDDGDVIRIQFVEERDHHPYRNGWLEYSRSGAAFAGSPEPNLARQARAYTESYLRRLK